LVSIEKYKSLNKEKTYKHPGIEESDSIHQQVKARLKKEYARILRMLMKSELHPQIKITVIGALVVPVLRYSFSIINWKFEEIREIKGKTKEVLTMYKIHHQKADIDRLYVKSKLGGRGLLQIEATYKTEIINIAEYLNTKYAEDQFVNIVKSYKSNQPNTNSTIQVATKVAEE
jgi:hypothetical protein